MSWSSLCAALTSLDVDTSTSSQAFIRCVCLVMVQMCDAFPLPYTELGQYWFSLLACVTFAWDVMGEGFWKWWGVVYKTGQSCRWAEWWRSVAALGSDSAACIRRLGSESTFSLGSTSHLWTVRDLWVPSPCASFLSACQKCDGIMAVCH